MSPMGSISKKCKVISGKKHYLYATVLGKDRAVYNKRILKRHNFSSIKIISTGRKEGKLPLRIYEVWAIPPLK